MIRLNAIPMDFEPRRKILPQLPEYVDPRGYSHVSEMSEFDSAFLCGALKTFRPKKILEVGVSAGGSTVIILQALEDLGVSYEMYSVDASIESYRDKSKVSGFMAAYAKQHIFGNMNGAHEFHLGKILPQVIDEIGGGIDFVILDTVHSLPGEVLDFLAVLPYLTDNAIVVLHDVSLHQIEALYENATGVLFGAVTAEKFLNFQPDSELFRYPNIAAFKVNGQTAENIENVFLSLILRWAYWPTDEQVKIYRQHYRRFYADALCEIFQDAVDMNAYNFFKAQNNNQ